MASDGAEEYHPLARLVEFARSLRAQGIPVGSAQLQAFCGGVSLLNPADLDDVYWAGRACLLCKRSEIEPYDRAFDAFFHGRLIELVASGQPQPRSTTVWTHPGDRGEGEGADESEGSVGALASDVEALRHKQFERCTPDELALLRRLIARLSFQPPRRRGRRSEPHRRGRRLDLRRSVRRSMRTGEELLEPSWLRRRPRRRRLVCLLDVSGSMADYSRALLQFSYSAARHGAFAEAETFCFATRLTRLTSELDRQDPDAALERATAAVVDWDGGTRIGEALAELRRSWGHRGLTRGAIALICSDGLERGEPDVLAKEMERLGRLAHRVVWVNPLKGDPGYEPLARGMEAALPFVDEFVSGHDLASLEELARLLPAIAERPARPDSAHLRAPAAFGHAGHANR